jgi:hypothetical protein
MTTDIVIGIPVYYKLEKEKPNPLVGVCIFMSVSITWTALLWFLL